MIALGGGVVGDMTGFAAACWLRGMDFVQVPTTLLAMVDAAIGGKTGVNHSQGKNLIGAFHQPRLVLIDPQVLKTLPAKELRAGMAEVIKYGVIWDTALWMLLRQAKTLDQYTRINPDLLFNIICRCAQTKAEIVTKDEKESGIRAILNYGHTVGHAIEAVTNYKLLNHGEAVAVGMNWAGWVAHQMGWWTGQEYEQQQEIIRKTKLPEQIPPLDPHALYTALTRDKKVTGGKIKFILPRSIGKVEITDQVKEELIYQGFRHITQA
jgi:3-dehydroquinate synthase